MTTAYAKEIRFDRETRDFAMYLNGDLAGFAPTYREAAAALDALVYALLTEAPGPVSSDLSAASAPQEPAQPEPTPPAVDAIEVAPLVGALVAVADAAYDVAPVEWRNAINKAYTHLVNEVEQVPVQADGSYVVNGHKVGPKGCDCKAASVGKPCYHKAARRLVQRALAQIECVELVAA